MPPLAPPCSRAVRCRLLSSSEFIWISDDVLSNVFRRFASSVPGPMESRRRVGKRRMTQLSGGTPSLAPPPGTFGGLFPGVDRTQWRWEPPNRQNPKQEAIEFALPSWLLGLKPSQGMEEDPSINDTLNVVQPQETSDSKETHMVAASDEGLRPKNLAIEDIQHFRESIRNALLPHDLKDIYPEFLLQMKQSLILGLVSGETLEFTLRGLSRDLQDAAARWQTLPGTSLSPLFDSAWEGLLGCKVLRPVDFDGKVMDSLLSLLAGIPFTESVQTLAGSLLASTSYAQRLDMGSSIKEVTSAWLQNWLAQEQSDCHQTVLSTTEIAVSLVDRSLDLARNCISRLKSTVHSPEATSIVRKALRNTRDSMSLALNAIAQADNVLNPYKAATNKLAMFLDTVPLELLPDVLESCSDSVLATAGPQEFDMIGFRYNWLLAVAQATNISHELFLRTWEAVDMPRAPFSESECCDLVLSHWISQGLVTNSVKLAIGIQSSDQKDFASLLLTIGEYGHRLSERTRDTFLILDRLGKYKMVYPVLKRMRSLNLRIPFSQVYLIIDIMIKYDTKLAMQVFEFFLHDRQRLSPSYTTKFIKIPINDPKIHPRQIWRMLRVPIYSHSRCRSGRRRAAHRGLSKGVAELFNMMALEFARCQSHSTRMALRNVSQCLYHLRKRRAPILPQMSKALAEVGITREIQRGQFVGQERLRYVISMIKQIEGEEVAIKVDEMVYRWRELLLARRARQLREANVLRVGPAG